MKLGKLIKNICEANDTFQTRAVISINQNLVARNWIFGYYLIEFEQNGEEYAQYGKKLLSKLSDELKNQGVSGVSYTNLTLCRKLFLFYPQIGKTLQQLPVNFDEGKINRNLQTLSEDFKKWQISSQKLIKNLSFSHFIHLLRVEDQMKRLFYEIECIKGNWSSRQLQRQIGSLLYERTGLSNNKKALLEQLEASPSSPIPSDIIRDPYVFEFLGLKPKEVFLESDLEEALLNHLQQFLLELGTGFCLEARQKSFLVDSKRYKIDLLFYHRILKCQVIIDLKMRAFSHEDAGQMNFYLNYFKENELQEGDNPPVGILLCTYKNEAVVRYATGGLDNQLFISQYMLRLPSEEMLQDFILKEKDELE